LDKKDILLIHGLGDSVEVWEPMSPYLSERFSVHTLSLPGHAPNTEIDDIGAAIQVVLNEFDALGLRNPYVVGHSAGAIICILLASQREVAGLVMLDQPLLPMELLDTEILYKTLDKDEIEKTVQAGLMALGSDRIVSRNFHGKNIKHLTYATLSVFWGAHSQDLLVQLRELLRSVRSPMFSLEWIPVDDDYSTTIREIAPRLVRETFADAQHHWFHIDLPEQTASRIASFIESAVTPE